MTIRLALHRLMDLEERTLGRLIVFKGLNVVASFATLELPWRNNQRNISRIPSALYSVSPRYSARFGQHLHVLDVPNRSHILFHVGNWPRNTDGCILVGMGFADIDNDGLLEVASSRIAMNQLNELVTEKTELIVL